MITCYPTLKHLKVHRSAFGGSGKLTTHLEEIDRVANKMYNRLVEQLKQRDGITEELKALNQTEWVRRMNTIRSEAETVVMGELIYE